MNYYMPFMSYVPQTQSVGLFSRLFKNGINWGTILSNTQKTLNIINQAIPVIKQAGPIVNNAKTMFKIMNEFKKVDVPLRKKEVDKSAIVKDEVNHTVSNQNNPVFFI